ncbi:hypothetical protein RF11_01052 [Thelohanellus kitauei]|uniref:Uncharacterized protein n=1 Tax=Thelohanellus kitauei TaxID=669202 RepID=A0A0C2MUT8_THEKT|nr:hypothetical protein RF11_01052 [Thelohanellus kitauei]
MPFYCPFCYPPIYPSYSYSSQYNGCLNMSSLPNYTDSQFMENIPQELTPTPFKNGGRTQMALAGWKAKKICCGTILVGPHNQVLLDPRYIRLHTGKCMYRTIYDNIHKKINETETSTVETPNVPRIVISGSSPIPSDRGSEQPNPRTDGRRVGLPSSNRSSCSSIALIDFNTKRE